MLNDFLIAVASRDGRTINQHLGHAERFLIYKIRGDKIEYIEERKVERYCQGEDTYEHPFEEERFASILDTIKDCKFVLVSMIGTLPEKRLQERGIASIMMYDSIENGIKKVIEGDV